VEYIGSIAAYDRKMPESDIRPRKNSQLSSYGKQIGARQRAFLSRKAFAAAKQAGKTYNTVGMGNIKFIWLCPC